MAAGEPCSFLTAEEVGAIVGTTPVEVAERVGRGDCDYWLNAAKDAKVEIGVFTGPDNATLFESPRALGIRSQSRTWATTPTRSSAPTSGPSSWRSMGDATIVVQVFTADTASQLSQAIELAKAVIANL